MLKQNSSKLTKRFIEALTPNEKQEMIIWDLELKGFGIRISPKGLKSYFVQYRNKANRTRRKKIGIHGIISSEQARDEAKIILGEIAKGEDPSEAKKKEKQKPIMRHLIQEYLEVYSKHKKTKKSYLEDKVVLESIILNKFGTKLVEEVYIRDFQLLHTEFKSTPYKANKILDILSKMFNLAIQWGYRADNPIKGIERYQEFKRNRWLNEEEMQKLWKILKTYPYQDIANAIRLLLLTGSRRNEVLHATWEQFDLKLGVWTKPAHTTKQRRMEHLPLSQQAIDILKDMKSHSQSDFLFPSKLPNKPLQDIKKSWNTIRKKAGLPDVRLHDLRHTHASHLVSNGLSLHIVGKLLGHTQASTTQRYAHLADEPLRQATEFFGSKVKELSL